METSGRKAGSLRDRKRYSIDGSVAMNFSLQPFFVYWGKCLIFTNNKLEKGRQNEKKMDKSSCNVIGNGNYSNIGKNRRNGAGN